MLFFISKITGKKTLTILRTPNNNDKKKVAERTSDTHLQHK